MRSFPMLSVLTTVGLAAALATGLTACGSSSTSAGGQSSATDSAGSAGGSGPVDVFYAGSLVDLMQKQISPGFQGATGYSFTGYSGGSTGLATQIKGEVHRGDVFISASPGVNDSLKGDTNGNWVTWYATYASSPLVIGYNPSSSFAAQLKSKPWNEVVTEPGVRFGCTDPKTDPKGKLGQQALEKDKLPLTTVQVYPEETLVARLQSGQLDAAFFYQSEAVAAGIATVPVNQDLKATYTVTILKNAPHPAAAEAFVRYLLGPTGKQVLQQDGFTLVSPAKVVGSGVPSGLQAVLPGS